jgi:hypothetical protein
MPEIAFVMSARQPYPLRELAATLHTELELQAVPSALHLGGFPEPRPSLVYVLLDPKGYVTHEGEDELPARGILRRTIFVCAEPPPAAGDDDHIGLLQKAGAVFALDQRSVLAMDRVGIRARLLRPGYSKPLDRFDPAAPRPIDVLFVGTHSLRRTRLLSRAARVLSRHNCVLQICEDVPNALDTGSPLAHARWPLLAQAKVLINLHRHEESRFDWGGAVDAIHAGAVVVTEPSSGMAPLVAGEHLVAANADSLPYVVEELLGAEQRLARLRSGAYERLRAWVPYALSVAVLRAAVVELVGEPVPFGAPLGRRLEPEPAAMDAAMPDSTPQVEPRTPEAPTSIEVVHESPAWGSRRAPRVTVLAVLRGGDESSVAGMLDSMGRLRLRDFELVLVAGPDSDLRHVVIDWMVAHPGVPSRLVAADVNGAAAAMNVGVDFARGRFLLILAPGQELYPRCLDVLTGMLEAKPELAFVYPMLEVTGSPDEFVAVGGDYLLNYLEWDAARIRAHNYIHAPALIRTDVLRQVGSFATDQRLAGFEDYDLWCRMAERGWRGRLAPQTLGRRTA